MSKSRGNELITSAFDYLAAHLETERDRLLTSLKTKEAETVSLIQTTFRQCNEHMREMYISLTSELSTLRSELQQSSSSHYSEDALRLIGATVHIREKVLVLLDLDKELSSRLQVYTSKIERNQGISLRSILEARSCTCAGCTALIRDFLSLDQAAKLQDLIAQDKEMQERLQSRTPIKMVPVVPQDWEIPIEIKTWSQVMDSGRGSIRDSKANRPVPDPISVSATPSSPALQIEESKDSPSTLPLLSDLEQSTGLKSPYSNWSCPKCTLDNPIEFYQCEACSYLNEKLKTVLTMLNRPGEKRESGKLERGFLALKSWFG